MFETIKRGGLRCNIDDYWKKENYVGETGRIAYEANHGLSASKE